MWTILKKILQAGTRPGDALDMKVACITTNVTLIIIFIVAIIWAGFVKSVLGNDFLYYLDIAMASVAVLLYISMWTGSRDFTRFALIILVSIYYISLNLALGIGRGTEFYAVPLCMAPLVIFPRHEDWKISLSIAITIITVAVTLIIISNIEPFLQIPEILQQQAYFLTVVSVIIVSFAVLVAFLVQINFLISKLEAEKASSNELLATVFPGYIVGKLTKSVQFSADNRYSGIVVLFIELTGLSQRYTQVEINEIITIFMPMLRNYNGLHYEEINTSENHRYVAACNVQISDISNLSKIIKFARSMMREIDIYCEEKNLTIPINIGIGYGHLVDGAIDTNNIYGQWAETMNLASRMKTTSEIGLIQVTESIYYYLQKEFKFKRRETVLLNNININPTYFLVDD